MLKRGTQGSAYWQLITHRPERRALDSLTNRPPRSTQDTVERAKQVRRAVATRRVSTAAAE